MHHKQEFALDLHQVAEISRDSSVVRFWLLDLASNALRDPQALQNIAAFMADSGESRWTVFEAVDLNVPAPVITLSLLQRLRSRESDSFSAKLLAALRNECGGHEVQTTYLNHAPEIVVGIRPMPRSALPADRGGRTCNFSTVNALR